MTKTAETAAKAGGNRQEPATASQVIPRIRILPLALSGDLPGTFSGLTRDKKGFYWTHTDGGAVPGQWAVRLVKLKVTPAGAEILEVIPIVDEAGAPVTGDKLDPEDIAVAPDGTLWLVDEIYPLIVQVSPEGEILRRVVPPARYADRVSGRGFEGCTISADGRTLFTILQTGLSTETDASHTWLVAYDLASGAFKEYPYYLDKPSQYAYRSGVSAFVGSSGLATLSPTELLVLERDNRSGADARVKRIYRVTVPAEPTEMPLEKHLFLDVHALGYEHEKLEGMALSDPHTLLLINDNDGDPNQPTLIWYLQF